MEMDLDADDLDPALACPRSHALTPRRKGPDFDLISPRLIHSRVKRPVLLPTCSLHLPTDRRTDMADAQPPQPPQEQIPEGAEASKGPSKNELKKQAKAAEKARKEAEKAARQAELEAQKAAAEVDFATEFYGKLPLNQSQSRPRQVRSQIASFNPNMDGQTVIIRARVQTSRAQGSKMVFLNLRQRTDSIQALLSVAPEKVSKQMAKWAAGLQIESIVLAEGIVKKAPEIIKSATVGDVELHLTKLHLISGLDGVLPFTVDDANRPEPEGEVADDVQFKRVLLDTRLNNRVVDLRTQTNQAVFKLQDAIGHLFREYLDERGFIEIHSPKLQGAATESGASVFQVGYFKGKAFLAQSPQLAKQMAIAADFERVYEIGPVFRAEDSNTHRHMTEFIGLDLEMAIEEHYHEVMELLDGLFKHMFSSLRARHSNDIEAVRKQFPAEAFKWREGPEGTLRLTFREAVDLLVADGVPREDLDDIDTVNEKRLGRIVRAKYDTDYFIIDKFPMSLRPFYTMPDPEDPTLSNSYDFFMRGEEILSGAQRIHDAALLAEKMRSKGVDPASMTSYLDAFKMGCPPHGGGGIGLERVLMLFLKLNNIRRASLFPRDPKRLEPVFVVPAQKAVAILIIDLPEIDVSRHASRCCIAERTCTDVAPASISITENSIRGLWPAMYISRAESESYDGCPPGLSPCHPSVGPGPALDVDDGSQAPAHLAPLGALASNVAHFGRRNFVGLVVIGVLVVIGLGAWVTFGEWPRRAFRRLAERGARWRRGGTESKEPSTAGGEGAPQETAQRAESEDVDEDDKPMASEFMPDGLVNTLGKADGGEYVRTERHVRFA
ncbi:Aspartate--tRNA ligase, cytoplasmic [Grifola frondosa]|uniref:Aspartate--tRNA ligase, cytoplasmic n=1 Tax=Grifola frondosa TaxID=5627 RepID=A0A1C7MNU3_GRIFR|nr:Aspartate--tRNA ligase, cytoplasmic [Grifola frondosa]